MEQMILESIKSANELHKFLIGLVFIVIGLHVYVIKHMHSLKIIMKNGRDEEKE